MPLSLPTALPIIIAIVIVPSMFGVFIKLSAKILHYKEITWKQGAIVGFIVVLLSLLGRIAWSFLDFSPPVLLGVVIGFSVVCITGGWFFSNKGINNSGNTLRWREALQLTALAYIMLGTSGLILVNIPKLLVPEIAP